MTVAPGESLRSRSLSILGVLVAFKAAAATLMIFALLLPAKAQFWQNSWSSRQPQRQQSHNLLGGLDRPGPSWRNRHWARPRHPRQRQRREWKREQPRDYSRAPPATPSKGASIKIVVMGDANAEWLAYGLEDVFSDKPEMGVLHKDRADSGLIRYDQHRYSGWPQIAREIIAGEKPTYVVIMVGNNDRQTIHEKPPAAVVSGAKEQQSVKSSTTAKQARQASFGPWEFHTDKWELAYIRRIDATIAALKSAGVPVIWVGLPSQRGRNASADSYYLNQLYRSRAEKAGIAYVDVWEGFVDEAGKFSPQGLDDQGHAGRLRSGDGVYFTKLGARKLARYVARKIERLSQKIPVALPVHPDPGNGKVGRPTKPAAGPVVSLSGVQVGLDRLLGGPSEQPPVLDPAANQSLITEGDAVPIGRADDFRWPHNFASGPTTTAASSERTRTAHTWAKPSASTENSSLIILQALVQWLRHTATSNHPLASVR